MSEEFLQYGKQAVFGDLSKDGLLFRFLSEYKLIFGKEKINLSCSKCKNDVWDSYTNLFKMKTKSNYVLKAKYNGIQNGFSGQPLRNGEMTDEQALHLLKTHPKGKELFDKIPEKEEVKKPKAKKSVKAETINILSEEVKTQA